VKTTDGRIEGRSDGRTDSLLTFQSKRALLRRLSVAGNNRTYLSIQAKCPIILSDFNQISNFLIDFHRRPNINFQINPSIVRRADARGQMDIRLDGWADGRTDITTVTSVDDNYVKAPKDKIRIRLYIVHSVHYNI
jgi:hypothetical protein